MKVWVSGRGGDQAGDEGVRHCCGAAPHQFRVVDEKKEKFNRCWLTHTNEDLKPQNIEYD